MLVRDVMQCHVVTVTPTTTLPDAVRLAAERNVRHLPVMDGDDLVGIVSDRDLKRAMASSAATPLTVAEFMSKPVMTIGRTFPVEHAAHTMVTEKISALPVTEGGRLIGIVTETDVLRLFVKTLGASEPSTRLDVMLGESPSALADAIHAVEESGATVSSIVSLKHDRGLREAVIRIATIDPRAALAALHARDYTVRHSWRG